MDPKFLASSSEKFPGKCGSTNRYVAGANLNYFIIAGYICHNESNLSSACVSESSVDIVIARDAPRNLVLTQRF
jgi:hypothetical protein